MSDKDHHRVHFGEETDSFGKDNEIVIKMDGEEKLSVHLGFLKVGHRYEIQFEIPRSVCGIDETVELKVADRSKVPNVNCKFLSLESKKTAIQVSIELLAYKEKLLKEELCLKCSDRNFLFRIMLFARVLGAEGTPLLRNGVHCIATNDEQ